MEVTMGDRGRVSGADPPTQRTEPQDQERMITVCLGVMVL